MTISTITKNMKLVVKCLKQLKRLRGRDSPSVTELGSDLRWVLVSLLLELKTNLCSRQQEHFRIIQLRADTTAFCT